MRWSHRGWRVLRWLALKSPWLEGVPLTSVEVSVVEGYFGYLRWSLGDGGCSVEVSDEELTSDWRSSLFMSVLGGNKMNKGGLVYKYISRNGVFCFQALRDTVKTNCRTTQMSFVLYIVFETKILMGHICSDAATFFSVKHSITKFLRRQKAKHQHIFTHPHDFTYAALLHGEKIPQSYLKRELHLLQNINVRSKPKPVSIIQI